VRWEIPVVIHGDSPTFIKGWAWATAVGVNFTKDGQLTTYTWSRWVFLTDKPVAELG
jgi:hypothetical protein